MMIRAKGLGGIVLAAARGGGAVAVGAKWDTEPLLQLLDAAWAGTVTEKDRQPAAIMADFHSEWARQFVQKNDVKRSLFVPLLADFAEAGMCDSVEFRRLARRALRPLRHVHTRVLLVAEPVLCTRDALRVLQSIAGSQLRVVPISQTAKSVLGASQKPFLFETIYDAKWTKMRAEKIIGRRIKAEQVLAKGD